MKTIDFFSLPKIKFSHIYNADTYSNKFSVQDDFIEITYISKGSLTFNIRGKEYIAKKDDVICILRQEETLLSSDCFHEHHTVAANVKWDFIPENTEGLILPLITPSELNTSYIRIIIDDFVHNQLTYKESPSKCAEKFFKLVCEIDRCNRKSKYFDLPGEILYIKRAKEYISKNIKFPIKQCDVAQHLSISPEYLCTVFKKTEGVTFIKYVNRIKLENIRAIMQQENIRLCEACVLYGFSDPNYVSKLFKQYFGYNITDKGNIADSQIGCDK